MDFSTILVSIGLAVAITGLLLALWLFFKMKKAFSAVDGVLVEFGKRLAEQEQAFEEDTTRRSNLLSERGRQGVEVREANKEMRIAAMNEGRTIIAGPGSIDEKKEKLLVLATKYPRVSEEVARALIREFHLEAFEGVIMPLVQQAAAGALSAPKSASSGTSGGFYGLG